MLVLNRKIGESVIIDSDIEISILEIKDGRVKLGIEAPKERKIFRKEVYEEVKKENQKSSNSSNILDILNLYKKKK